MDKARLKWELSQVLGRTGDFTKELVDRVWGWQDTDKELAEKIQRTRLFEEKFSKELLKELVSIIDKQKIVRNIALKVVDEE